MFHGMKEKVSEWNLWIEGDRESLKEIRKIKCWYLLFQYIPVYYFINYLYNVLPN